jgi:hypothetical protein
MRLLIISFQALTLPSALLTESTTITDTFAGRAMKRLDSEKKAV